MGLLCSCELVSKLSWSSNRIALNWCIGRKLGVSTYSGRESILKVLLFSCGLGQVIWNSSEMPGFKTKALGRAGPKTPSAMMRLFWRESSTRSHIYHWGLICVTEQRWECLRTYQIKCESFLISLWLTKSQFRCLLNKFAQRKLNKKECIYLRMFFQ